MPILYSQEVVEDADDVRRTWTALFNAFLHPAMERFLYSAEHQLREHKAGKPLLIFRNDGHSARVAKTIALKTYSSGRSEEHTSELQSLMRISYAVFCLKQTTHKNHTVHKSY